MDVFAYYPFNELKLPSDERVLWHANHGTFHRVGDYGIVITDRALYLYSPFWLLLRLARWRRFSRAEIRSAAFHDSRRSPRLEVELEARSVSFRTPWDDPELMDVDRENLSTAARLLMQPHENR